MSTTKELLAFMETVEINMKHFQANDTFRAMAAEIAEIIKRDGEREDKE